MIQLSTPWGDPLTGNGPPVRRFLSNYFDHLFHTKRGGAIPTGTPLTGASNARGYEIIVVVVRIVSVVLRDADND